ncbi:unnamed protein product [Prorocentrum cordatum]|nr:unnamed protein product [Polarella glacialis]
MADAPKRKYLVKSPEEAAEGRLWKGVGAVVISLIVLVGFALYFTNTMQASNEEEAAEASARQQPAQQTGYIYAGGDFIVPNQKVADALSTGATGTSMPDSMGAVVDYSQRAVPKGPRRVLVPDRGPTATIIGGGRPGGQSPDWLVKFEKDGYIPKDP